VPSPELAAALPVKTLRLAIEVAWLAFWVYWLISAVNAKQGSGRGLIGRMPGVTAIVTLIIVTHIFKTNSTAVHVLILQLLGSAMFLAGIGLAVWARVHLGRNWGMPMTLKDEPELVTSGPYRFIRHPIYSGILLALLGTAIATNLYWLIVLVVMACYFIYSARTEERLMASSFPDSYRSYKSRTKMLIPFVL
jgi:protein-S-isoprenylcysteine O-methyltransferase Ste14